MGWQVISHEVWWLNSTAHRAQADYGKVELSNGWLALYSKGIDALFLAFKNATLLRFNHCDIVSPQMVGQI